jgi:hypothetical protein
MTLSLTNLPSNNANQRELASKVFIEIGWACEGFKATTALCQPCQSRYWRR